MDSKELTEAGRKWLKVQWRKLSPDGFTYHGASRGGCSVIAVDKMSFSGERPDLIGWSENLSTLIEVKKSRSDFFRDDSKTWRQYGPGMGQVRWYLTPRGLVTIDEVPHGYGLLEWDGEEITVAKMPIQRGDDYDIKSERMLLLSLLRAR